MFRQLKLELWQNKPCCPRELLPWKEGSTQVDATITWANPPTTIYLELKYGSDLSETTAGNDGAGNYPADQLIRNLRVGLLENGWLRPPGLFAVTPRDFVLILVAPKRGHPLVKRYRNVDALRAAIPQSELIHESPRLPFFGEIGYAEIVQVLRRQRRWFSRPERIAVDELVHYLQFKSRRLNIVPGNHRSVVRQEEFPEFELQT